jgi:hypothetical protein
MTRIFCSSALFVASLLAFPIATEASVIVYYANLSGAAESPPNASPGFGSAVVTVDDVANTMRVQVSFFGLSAPTTASHIHSATAIAGIGTAGVATTTPFFANFPIGVTSGTYDRLLDLTLASSYNPAFITANGGTPATAEAALLSGLAAGKAYLNIHTTAFTAGEIRGFLVTPEPASLCIWGFGSVGLALVGWRLRTKPTPTA